MVHKIFTIRDAKGEFYTQPFIKKTHGEAERDFRMLVNDEKSQINQFPEDYDLYYLGTFDDESGKMETSAPTHLIAARNLLKDANKAQVLN